MRFEILGVHGAPAAKRLAAGKSAMAGRRTEFRSGFPVGTEFVKLLALGGISENFVGFVDLLEFFLGLFFVLGDVGMILARELAEGFFDLVVGRGARDAEGLVIIFVLNGHSEFQVKCSKFSALKFAVNL